MEAADKVDSGDVWQKRTLHFEGNELFDELFDRLFATELALMDFAVDNFHSIVPLPQPAIEGSYYRKRGPEDGRVHPTQTIAEIFDLVRVSDPARYPVFFDHRGCRYVLQLQKVSPPPLLPGDGQ
jgi:methionyl-tRNA formyltransferase